MNERIRELNLQALSNVINGGDPDGDIDRMYIPSEFTKKFAELIVRECIDTVSDCSIEYCTRPQIVSEIKEHFGVEK